MDNAADQIYVVTAVSNPSCSASQKTVEVPPQTPQINLDNVEDLSSGVCRVCAAVTEFLIPIFHGEGLQNNLAEKIHKHLPIQVTEQDVLPQAVCYQCTHTLLAWHELVACCVQADRALRARIQHSQGQPQHDHQEQKPTTNEECQSLENKNHEFGAHAVPPPPYEEPRTRTCGYCNAQHPEATYKQHLFDEHTELLFHCEECDAYVDKKDFIPHMSVHAVEYATNQEKTTKKVKKVKKNKEVREVKINSHKEVKEEKINLHDDRAKNLKQGETSREISTTQDSQAKVTETFQQSNIPETVREVDIDKTQDNYKGKIEIEIFVSSENTTTVNTIEHQNNNSLVNEFSDHSDTDFDFGPLPESVFEAIEDSEDSETLESTETTLVVIETNDNATNHVNNASDVTESPRNKEKKHKKTRTCPICAKVYNASSSYFYHIKYFHKQIKEHECNICKRRFGTKGSLNQHATIHTGECQFECKECGKRFRAKASLYIHEQTHKGIKTYSCTQCQISFRWRTHLQRHMKRHSAEKSHVCSICGRGFSIRCDLLRHAKTHSVGNYTCDKCGVKFAQLRYLKVHMDKKHSSSIVADQAQNVPSA